MDKNFPVVYSAGVAGSFNVAKRGPTTALQTFLKTRVWPEGEKVTVSTVFIIYYFSQIASSNGRGMF